MQFSNQAELTAAVEAFDAKAYSFSQAFIAEGFITEDPRGLVETILNLQGILGEIGAQALSAWSGRGDTVSLHAPEIAEAARV